MKNTVSDRIAAELKAKIRSGALKPGARVPSARELVRDEGIALATAAKVLERLKRERLVKVVPGVGTVVRGDDRAPDLSRERIVEAAIAIADDDGLAGLTMRGVATEMGVPTMSIYRHVPSREELVFAMIDAVMTALEVPVFKPRDGWRQRLTAMAEMQWQGYERHPWLPPAISMTRPQPTPAGMAHTEMILAALEPLGMGASWTLQTAIAFIAHVRGMAQNLEPEREAERDTGMDSVEWMTTNEQLFAQLLPRFPTLARISESTTADITLGALFERGLTCFLDGIEAQASQSASMRT